MLNSYKKYISSLKDTKNLRKLQDVKTSAQDQVIDFSSNDYLLLSRHPGLLKAGIQAAETYGNGATGSRLLSGNKAIFTTLEQQIAYRKQSEAALYFSSGYLANFATLSSLLDKKVLGTTPIVFFDKLNHASLYQAVFVSQTELVRYQHNNINQLSDLLDKYASDSRPKFIVTETVFGMDGDRAPLGDIVHLAHKYSAFLYLDEAHATGILGKDGYGLSTEINLQDIPNIVMGTFSKALGGSGGYIACSNLLKDYLLNRASGFVYSTAPTPFAAGLAKAAWELLPSLATQRESLQVLAQYTRHNIQSLGFDIGQSSTHIIPIILKTTAATLSAQELLQRHNIIVSAIRPPTVPPATARLRIALNSGITQDNINSFLNILRLL